MLRGKSWEGEKILEKKYERAGVRTGARENPSKIFPALIKTDVTT